MRAIDGIGSSGNGDGSGVPGAKGRGKQSKWPLLVMALLGGHVAILVAVVVVATRDPSFAVTPNYYENAVNWDRSQAQKRASAKLGWKLEIVAADEADAKGRRAVTFALTDPTGAAIGNATLTVTCFHHARATEPTRLNMMTAADGRAIQLLPIRHAGFWDFQCNAVAPDGRMFTATVTQYVNPPVRLASSAATAGGAAR